MFVTALQDQSADVKPAQIIGEAIRKGIAPFDPGEMKLYLSRHLEGPSVITVTVGLFPDLPFIYQIDPFDSPTNQVYLAANRAMLFYRNRPHWPVEDHIVLGED